MMTIIMVVVSTVFPIILLIMLGMNRILIAKLDNKINLLDKHCMEKRNLMWDDLETTTELCEKLAKKVEKLEEKTNLNREHLKMLALAIKKMGECVGSNDKRLNNLHELVQTLWIKSQN